MTIGTDTLLWLVSTAPQVLAAITGLSLAALTFKVGSIDDQIARDETLYDALNGLKVDFYHRFRRVVIFSISIIIVDLLYINFSDWIISSNVRLIWMLILFFVANLICLILLCVFPLKLINPNHYKKVVDKLVNEYNKGGNTVDPGKFLVKYRELENTLRKFPNFSNNEKFLSTIEMIRGLLADGVINKDQYRDLKDLNRLRNLVAHEPDIREVDGESFDHLKEYIDILKGLSVK